MATWSKATVLRFIDTYKSKECLWKVKSKDYSNRVLREKAYEDLVAFCKAFNADANKDVVLKKISNLRNTFKKELKKHENSKLSLGCPGCEEVYEPKLWYFQNLLFLRDQEAHVQSRYNVPRPERSALLQCEEENACPSRIDSQDLEVPTLSPQAPGFDVSGVVNVKAEEEQQQQPLLLQQYSHESLLAPLSQPTATTVTARYRLSPQAPWRSRSRHEDEEDGGDVNVINNKAARVSMRLLDPPPPPPPPSADRDDQHDAFGKNVAHKLRSLPREQRIYAEKIICDALFEAELGSLTRHSSIMLMINDNK